jgi:hypothetical protein
MFFIRFFPRLIPNKIYKTVFKRDISWNNPIDLIEKIQWMQLYSDTGLWTICADKYLVREFVIERGCGHVLNELYGIWYDANDIDWALLPNSFVLKTNHSCGQVILVKDKNMLQKNSTILQLNSWVRAIYGVTDAQIHYSRIRRCIIAEKLFINLKEPEKSLIDYKIWCFHGVPECVLIVYNRTESDYSLTLYDLDWNNISEKAFNKNNSHYRLTEIDKPKSFEVMLDVAKKLSKGFPQVRVDFYDIDDKAIFGEMTFTTGYGYFSEEYYNYLGSKIDLSTVPKLKRHNYL